MNQKLSRRRVARSCFTAYCSIDSLSPKAFAIFFPPQSLHSLMSSFSPPRPPTLSSSRSSFFRLETICYFNFTLRALLSHILHLVLRYPSSLLRVGGRPTPRFGSSQHTPARGSSICHFNCLPSLLCCRKVDETKARLRCFFIFPK